MKNKFLISFLLENEFKIEENSFFISHFLLKNKWFFWYMKFTFCPSLLN